MTAEEWAKIRAHGRRWLYFGAERRVVRVIRWYPSGVRVRFTDTDEESTVHPEGLSA